MKPAKVIDRDAIWKLIATVESAVAEYDKSGDHLRHAPGEDCIRCRLLEALGRKP